MKGSSGVSPQEGYDKAKEKLSNASTDKERFYALNFAAKGAFDIGKYEEAKVFAEELEKLTPNFKSNWNSGNSIQDFNIVLGRLAVKNGDLEKAGNYLLEAGRSPGSPQMNSFGPNMSLAKDLLAEDKTDVVIEYFNLCRTFWKNDSGDLDEWAQKVKSGKMPKFGANLVY